MLLSGALFAQNSVSGKVIDAKTGAPLAFVNIVANAQRAGTSSDIDGRFSLNAGEPITQLSLTYVGYEPQVLGVPGKKSGLIIKMAKKSYSLRQVEIFPGENPAHRIVRNVFANRKENHGQRRVPFSYMSYSKFVLTGEQDSAAVMDEDLELAFDTTDFEVEEFLETHHLFLMESITKRNFKPPDRDHEEVLATRVSGLKDPSILALAAQTKTFSFYEQTIKVGDKTYLSPISRGSTDQYLYILEDTLWSGNDTVFVMTFRPRSGKKFDGLSGLLYINSDGYAIQNIIAEPVDRDDGFNLKIQQQHRRVQGQWFPVQLNAFIYFDSFQVDNWKVIGVARAYLKDIKINPELKAKDLRGPEIEVAEGANTRKKEFWAEYRSDTLDPRDANTYHFLDSVGEELKLDRRLKGLEAILSGKLPYKFIDFDLDRILAVNGYEGFRLGLGVHTNKRFSKLFRVGGYGAYGFKDKAWKYGADGTVIIDWRKEMEFNVGYENDVLESGGVDFYGDRNPLGTEYYRKFYINRMDRYEKVQATLSFRAFEHFKFWLYGNNQLRQVTDDYRYLEPVADGVTLQLSEYYFTEVGISTRFAYNERIATTLDRVVSLGTNAPILYLNVKKGFDDLLDGEFDYWHFDLKFEKKFKLPRWGEPSFKVLAGYVDGNVPYTQLFNMRGTNSGFNVAASGTFETMHVNEFLADRYAAIFLRHDFKDLLIRWGKFHPHFILVTNVGIGALNNPQVHGGITFNTMEDGYFESGLQIDHLIRYGPIGAGIGAFYRYGPYSYKDFDDNVALKLTIGFDI